MPAPGPGGSWIDDFEGNKLDSKWVPIRYSFGGQNDGVWVRDIKNSKLHAYGVNGGTEGGQWGEIISLPVNAPGDIIVEMLARQKRTAGTQGELLVCVNNTRRNGPAIGLFGGAINIFVGMWGGAALTRPSFPASPYTFKTADDVALLKFVRTNGNMRMYIEGSQYAGFAFATTITSIDINLIWSTVDVGTEKWIEYISVWPREVVR